jgi:group I intron endonuclease
MIYYIYKITNLVNNKIYIGQTNNPKRRWIQHKSFAKYNPNHQLISRAINKYGFQSFNFDIIACAKNIENIKTFYKSELSYLNSVTQILNDLKIKFPNLIESYISVKINLISIKFINSSLNMSI